MRKTLHLALATVLLLGAGAASAQGGGTPSSSAEQKMQERITREVRHELVMLPYLTIFDNLAYKVEGDTVTLYGQVQNPVNKQDAQNAVKKIEGVAKVNNQIQVLPPSPNDDRIRRRVARAIFSEDGLSRYSMGALPPIHIIVNGGHVTLEGVVDSQSDKNLAFIRANGVPGVFSVQNNLRVENETQSKK